MDDTSYRDNKEYALFKQRMDGFARADCVDNVVVLGMNTWGEEFSVFKGTKEESLQLFGGMMLMLHEQLGIPFAVLKGIVDEGPEMYNRLQQLGVVDEPPEDEDDESAGGVSEERIARIHAMREKFRKRKEGR